MDVNRALRNAAQTGTVTLGLNETLKTVLSKKAKLVVLAANAPEAAVSQIQAAAEKVKTPIYRYAASPTASPSSASSRRATPTSSSSPRGRKPPSRPDVAPSRPALRDARATPA
jgi:hypothetical protein